MAFGLDDILAAGLKIIDKFIPDPEAKARAQLEMMNIKQAEEFKKIDAALQEQQMQADINKQEAASDHIFVAGWRPFIGWVCGLALALQFLIFPLMAWIALFWQVTLTFPELPVEMFYGLLFGMLGIGGMRSWEKSKGVKNGGA